MRRFWPDRYATPLFWLRCRLNRCLATESACFRKPVHDFPLPACAKHYDAGWVRIGLLLRGDARKRAA